MSNLPTASETIFCEDIRREVGNKMTLVGFLAGDNLIFPANAEPGLTIPKLGFLTRFKDGDGKWTGSWSISDPDGNEVMRSVVDFEVFKKVGINHTVVTVTAVPVPKFGQYTYVVDLSGQTYEFQFDIKKQ